MDANDLKNFSFLEQYISKDDVLVDVGANFGDYTEFFKNKLNSSGKIYSIELHPNTYKTLQAKFINDKNINVLNYAVSNSNGVIPFYNGKDAWTNNIIGHDMNFAKNEKGGDIESIRLDELLKDEPIIKLIKIDVEGAELMVLEGLKNILTNIKHILVECHLNEDWVKIRTLLLSEYKLDCININTGEKITADSNRSYQCFCKNI